MRVRVIPLPPIGISTCLRQAPMARMSYADHQRLRSHESIREVCEECAAWVSLDYPVSIQVAIPVDIADAHLRHNQTMCGCTL